MCVYIHTLNVHICTHINIHIYMTELLCCMPETNINILNQLYFNLKQKEYGPSESERKACLKDSFSPEVKERYKKN